jgi:hypothetical protein
MRKWRPFYVNGFIGRAISSSPSSILITLLIAGEGEGDESVQGAIDKILRIGRSVVA